MTSQFLLESLFIYTKLALGLAVVCPPCKLKVACMVDKHQQAKNMSFAAQIHLVMLVARNPKGGKGQVCKMMMVCPMFGLRKAQSARVHQKSQRSPSGSQACYTIVATLATLLSAES